MTTLPADYANRVYAGWLGKCIGVRFGAPTESLTYKDIKTLFGELNWYLQTDPRIFHPDDDLTVPLLMLRVLDDYGDDPATARFGDVWLNTIADGRGTLWWGGYGISSEHTAYANLQAGVAAPHSGSIATNGPVIAQQIGGQIFSDCWGMICPNNPARAAELAKRAAQVSHDGWAVHGGMFVAAMNAVAFSASSAREIVARALEHIPADSHYAEVVREVQAFHAAHPDDWHACYAWIHANRGYKHYPGRVHVIPNAAVCVMAMLYGNDDYIKTIQIANMGGWDTDCNAGNVGSAMGVFRGIDGIPMAWRAPLNDFFTLASLTGSRNMQDVGSAADLIIHHGYRQAGLPAPKPQPRFRWAFAGSTQGWEPIAEGPEMTSIAQTDDAGQPALRITATEIFRRRKMGAFTRTYIRPEELDGNNYKGSFSPTIYPGQTIRCRVKAHPDAQPEMLASLFVKDANSGQRIEQAPAVALKLGEWVDLTWRIPPMSGACLSQVGVLVTAMHTPRVREAVYLADFDWAGRPEFSIDFAKERIETDAASQWSFVRGFWSLEGDAYVGSGVGQNESYTGDIGWTDTTVSAELTPIYGDAHMLLTRVQGAIRSYALALLPGRLALFKNDKGYTEVASTPLDWQLGQRYTLTLDASGGTLTGRCGDARIAWADANTPYLSGMIGLANQRGCRTQFRAVSVH